MLLAAGPAPAAEVLLGANNKLIFSPSTVTVQAGETVTWTRGDSGPHDVVFDTGPEGVDLDALSHRAYIKKKGEAVSSTFTTPGTYSYYCAPHKSIGMKGTIIVE